MIRQSNFHWPALLILVLPSCSDGAHTEPEQTASTTPLPARVATYLRASSPRLVIEIDAVSGLAPYPESSTFVTSWLADVIDKPEGIAVEAGETLPAV